MQTKWLTWIGIGAAGLGLAAATHWRSAAGRGLPPSVASTRVIEREVTGDDPGATQRLRSQVAQLELKVAALSAQLSEPKTAGSAAAAAQEAQIPPADTSAEQAERDRIAWEAHMTAVDADFQAEARDGRWASATTSLVRERAMRDQVMRAALKDIDCRSTVCRVDLVDDQKGEFARKLPNFIQSLNGTFPSGEARTTDNADGTKTLSIYLSTTSGDRPTGAEAG